MLEPRWLAGLLLLVGSVGGGFLVGLGVYWGDLRRRGDQPSLAAVFTAPEDVALRLIAHQTRAWRVANAGFAFATILSTAGFWTLPEVVGRDGAGLTRAAAAAYTLSAGLWLVSLLFRISVTPGVAATFVATGSIDPAYSMIGRLAGGLFVAFMVIAGGSLLAFGVAILAGGAIVALAGWAAIVVGVVIIGGFVLFGDMLPAVVYLPNLIVGLALLIPSR